MSDEWAPAPPPKPPRRWPRRLLWIACGTFVFLLVAYFVATSHFFLESFILPKVSDTLHATVTVGDSSISPFFKVTLEKVKIQTSAMEDPLLTAKEIRARYSLISILRGNIKVDEATIDSPTVQIIEYADGSRNIDRILKALSSGKPSATPSKPGPPPQLEIKNILLTNTTLRLVRNGADGSVATAEVSNLVFAASNLQNGKAAKINVGLDLKLDQTPGQMRAKTPSSLLLAKLGGDFELGFSPDMQPGSALGQIAFNISAAPDAFKDLVGLRAQLDCNLTPTDLTQLTFSLSRNDKPMGQVSLSGPLDILTREGKVKMVISGIDRQLLNFFGAARGMDFGSSALSSTNEIELRNGGQVIAVNGHFSGSKLSVAQKDAASKPVDIGMDYRVTINKADQTALVSAFTLTGTQGDSPLINGKLTRPMKLSFGDAAVPDESGFDLTVTNLNLADWRGFIGDYAGMAGLKLNLLAQQGGKKIKLDTVATVTDFSANAGSRKTEPADVTVTVHAGMDNFDKVQLDEYSLQLLRQKQTVLAINSTGNYGLKSKNGSLETKMEASMADLAGLAAMPGLAASSGAMKLDLRLTQTNLTPGNTNNPVLDQTVSGSWQLDNFTGRYGANQFAGFGGSVDLDAEMKGQALEIRKLAGALNQNGKSAGSFAVSGNYNVASGHGGLQASVLDLNQNALQPFLAPLLGNMTLASANINVNASAAYDAKGESSLRGEFKLADFLVRDPAGQLPNVPLTAEIKLDAGMRDNLAKIGECSGRIDQGDQPGGRFDVSGSYDLQKKAGDVALKITDLNQNALRPLLAAKLGERTLKSITISAATTAKYDAKGESAVNGEVHVSDLVIAEPHSEPVAPLAIDVSLDAMLRDSAAEIRNFTGNAALGGARAGSITLNGKYDMQKEAGQAAFKITDLNQNALAPFLGSAMGDRKLTSVSIAADATATYDALGESAVKGQFAISNLVVMDPEGKLPKNPLALEMQVDAGMTGKAARLGQVQLTWYDKAGRTQVLLGGKVDLTKPDSITGDLQISSDSIALTPLFDLMNNPAKTAAPAKTAPTTKTVASQSTTTETEPVPVKLPFQQFTVDARIKELTLREVAVRDFRTTIQLNGGHVNVKPFEMTLNNAPVSLTADVNLETPGYEYAVTFAADKLPMEPLVNTFAPTQRGHIRGDLIAKADLRGAGITGRNLKKSLSGQASVTTDKANIELVPKIINNLLTPIAFYFQQPALANSPITYVNANLQAGGGVIKLSQFDLNSKAFAVNTSADIPIANVLMDSPLNKTGSTDTNVPVHLSLEYSLANRLKLASGGGTNAYSQLPDDFVNLHGTLGDVKPTVHERALAGRYLKNSIFGNQPSTPSLSNPVSTPSTPSLTTPTTPTAPSVPSAPTMPTAPSVPSVGTPQIPSVSAPIIHP